MRNTARNSCLPVALLATIATASATASAQSASYQIGGSSSGAAFGSALAGAGDVDGDGRGDWLVGAPLSNGVGAASLRSGATGAALWSRSGDSLGDQVGNAIAALGDVDGDGDADVAIGAWLDDPAGLNSGRVWIASGATGVTLREHAGAAAHEHAGHSLAALGDVDLDGVPDYAIGAPGAGTVRKYSGASGALLSTHSGASTNGYGMALCGPGDVDGDGAGDLVIGAPFFDGAVPDIGRAIAYSGASGAPLWSSSGTSAFAQHGAVLAALADFDADGAPELAIGAPASGAVSLCSGANGAPEWSADFDGSSGAAIAAVGDWNGDAQADLVVGDPVGSGKVRLLSGVDGVPFSEVLGEGNSSTSELFGSAVAALGDVDGDGRIDFVVGAPQASFLGAGAGCAVVITHLGTGAGSTPLVLACNGPQLGFSSTAPYVAACGDLDGDGRGDFVVGAPADEPTGGNGNGRVQVRSSASGAVLANHFGVELDAQLGAAVAGVGDVDLDGVPDYAAGAPRENGAFEHAGAVRVWSGATHALLHEFHGATADAVLGTAVSDIGDFNGDGHADILMGAPQHEGPGSTFGTASVYVRSGRTGAVLLQVDGDAPGDRFGSAVAGIGDVDMDLVPDFAVGGWGDSSFSSYNGKAQLLSGASGSPLHVHYGANGAQTGHVVARAGDVDGDGVQDWLANAPLGAYQEAAVFSGADGALLLVACATKSSSGFARGIGAAGDLDGDGRADLLVGESNVSTNQGALHVHTAAGGPPLFTWTPPGAKLFGQSVASLGDLDGDGLSELASAAASSATVPWRVLVYSGAPHSLGASPIALSVAHGGTQAFALDAGAAHAAQVYLLLGTLSGTTPGIPIGPWTLPLNPDAYFQLTLSAPNQPPLTASLGLLDSKGKAAAAVTLPGAGSPTLVGLHAHHAFVALDGAGVAFVSNPTELELQ